MPERSRDRLETTFRQIDVMPLCGRFSFTEQAIGALEALLPTYRGADGSHEGIAFLCGLELPTATLYTTAIAPQADHGRRHVRCSETEIAAVSAAARKLGLGLLAQVHTHPGDGTVHSLGDDEMVLMPFEGMLSIVCPLYGRFALRPLESLGVHQFQDGRWVLAEPESVKANLSVLPGAVDLR
jgi:hypothetical protein